MSRGVIFSNDPTALLHFSNIIYGNYLVFFTKLFYSINFYTVNNFALIIISLITISYNILLNSNYKTLILFLIILLPFTFNLFTTIQFTILSSVLFISGVISIFSYVKLKHTLLLYYGIISIIFSSLIRFEQTIIIASFILPVAFFIIYKLKESRKKTILIFSSVFIVCFLLSLYNKNYYKNVANYDFNEYNVRIASLFYDFKLLDKISSVDKKIALETFSISENDAKLYNAFYLTPLLINKAKTWNDKEIASLYKKISNHFFNITTFLTQTKYFENIYVFFIILAFLINHYISKKRINIFLFFGISLIYFFLVSLSINYFLKPMPFRTILSVTFCILSLSIFYFVIITEKKHENIYIYSLACLLLIFNSIQIKKSISIRKEFDFFNYNGLKSVYSKFDTTKKYVFYPPIKLLSYISVYDTFDWAKSTTIYRNSLMSQHPIILQNYTNLKYAFDSQMFSDKNIRYITTKNSEKTLFPNIKKYYQEHYNCNIDILKDEKIYGNEYYSYKFIYLGKYKN
ncbi:MAG: hypothetical protein V4667_06710 [Bacteroidota bacterium]